VRRRQIAVYIVGGVVLLTVLAYAATVFAVPLNCPWGCWICMNNC
jgi:hypothetical protein